MTFKTAGRNGGRLFALALLASVSAVPLGAQAAQGDSVPVQVQAAGIQAAVAKTVQPEALPVTTMQGSVRPQRSQKGDFDPGLFAYRVPPAGTVSSILTEENIERSRTKQFIERFTAPSGIAWLNSVIENGNTYIPFVRREIARMDLPQELVFVPFVESDYIGTAHSRAGAVGLWQFMMNSIAPFGIKVDELVDERRDFRKATVAALRKLNEHYGNFGSWPMAFAAYNLGPNGLRRAADSAGTVDYWVLSEQKAFPQQTVDFVPKLVAVSYVIANARRYGVDWWPEGIEWTAIVPDRQLSLEVVAGETGTDGEILRRLNLELLHGISPVGGGREILIPASSIQAVSALLENQGADLVQYYRYRVEPGDTLWSLSRHYGISVSSIERQNPGLAGRYLRPGETIVIPAVGEVSPIERQPVTLSRPFNSTHVVAEGDTLWSLSRLYGVGIEELATANAMELGGTLSIGRTLRVPIIEG